MLTVVAKYFTKIIRRKIQLLVLNQFQEHTKFSEIYIKYLFDFLQIFIGGPSLLIGKW